MSVSIFLGKLVRSNSCAGKTVSYTDKDNNVDVIYMDVYKAVALVPHYTDQNFAQCSEKGAHINWLTGGSQYLFAKQKLSLRNHVSLLRSEYQLAVGSSGGV